MALDVGTVVAGYTIEGVLGAGGMGTVYRARNPTLPRSDALKVLSAELSQDDQFRARFTGRPNWPRPWITPTSSPCTPTPKGNCARAG
jgi:serine/threonine protein kinase